jgi:tRNA G46 methylase TrmB
MYGLPGDPNSRRLNRNATETRVHNLWVGADFLTLAFFASSLVTRFVICFPFPWSYSMIK